MVWATVGTPITPNNQWQFTAPVEGEFFRLKHTRSPGEPKAWICQAEKLEDDSYQIFDVQPIHANNPTESFKLKKPAIFTNRCVGLRYVVDYKSPWVINLEVSNVFSPTSPNTSEPSKTLTYLFDGDANGVCYWLGTNYGTETWVNPHTAGRVTCSIINPFDSNRPPHLLVDRQPTGEPATSDAPNSKMRIDLGINNKLKPNYYSLRGADRANLHLRFWKFQVTNDDTFTNWTILDTQTNNTSINQNSWFSGSVVANEGYRYLEIEQLGQPSGGTNIMTLGEWEFYGSLYKDGTN